MIIHSFLCPKSATVISDICTCQFHILHREQEQVYGHVKACNIQTRIFSDVTTEHHIRVAAPNCEATSSRRCHRKTHSHDAQNSEEARSDHGQGMFRLMMPLFHAHNATPKLVDDQSIVTHNLQVFLVKSIPRQTSACCVASSILQSHISCHFFFCSCSFERVFGKNYSCDCSGKLAQFLGFLLFCTNVLPGFQCRKLLLLIESLNTHPRFHQCCSSVGLAVPWWHHCRCCTSFTTSWRGKRTGATEAPAGALSFATPFALPAFLTASSLGAAFPFASPLGFSTSGGTRNQHKYFHGAQ